MTGEELASELKSLDIRTGFDILDDIHYTLEARSYLQRAKDELPDEVRAIIYGE